MIESQTDYSAGEKFYSNNLSARHFADSRLLPQTDVTVRPKRLSQRKLRLELIESVNLS